MASIAATLRRAAEAVAALFMALMFATFLLQVAVRYGARFPALTEALPMLRAENFGWTLEFCLALWVWLVFWGNAFVVRTRDHVTFDVLLVRAPLAVRRAMLAAGGLAVGLCLLATIPATWDRLAILRLKQTATLGDLLGDWVRMRDIYAVYMLFLVAVGLRALASAAAALSGRLPDDALGGRDDARP